jgi:putative endonuclease
VWRPGWRSLGSGGERLAARYLRRHGYRILERSYRCSLGEIDLVARRDQLYVFVEVKTRRSDQHGEPWTAVDKRKQRQVTRAAVFYLKANAALDVAVRFDVIGITWPPGWFARPRIEHFESAFQAEGPWSI